MRLLKTLLRQAVPAMEVFLDMDDLEGGGGIEFVDMSEHVMLFISDGYVRGYASLARRTYLPT